MEVVKEVEEVEEVEVCLGPAVVLDSIRCYSVVLGRGCAPRGRGSCRWGATGCPRADILGGRFGNRRTAQSVAPTPYDHSPSLPCSPPPLPYSLRCVTELLKCVCPRAPEPGL